MGKAIKHLLRISSANQAPSHLRLPKEMEDLGLDELLAHKNGFYTFTGALLVRPSSSYGGLIGCEEWNNTNLWKGAYDLDLSGHFVFAENIFGEPYSITSESIFHFDPEVAEFTEFAPDLEGWAAKILADPNYHAGYELAHAWQSANGALQAGERLGPRVPFVLGGEFTIDNLARQSDIDLMRFRAQLANQIHDLPDGSEIKLQVTE